MKKLQRDYVDMLANASYLALLLVPFLVNHPDVWQYTFWVIAAIALLAWSSSIARYLAIASQPISKIAASAQGYVELMGKIKFVQKEKITSPSGEACVWYRRTKYELDEEPSTFDSLWHMFSHDLLTILGLSIKDSLWRQTHEERSEPAFLIEDDTGECLVKPEHADFFTKITRTFHESAFVKYEEELLQSGEKIYVLGEFKIHGLTPEAVDEEKATQILLAEWKTDKENFHHRFDTDKNGVIDLKEWEKARRTAVQEVRARQQSANAWHEIAAPRDGRMFLISAFSPQELKNKFLGWLSLHLFVLALSLTLALTFKFNYVGNESFPVSESPNVDAGYMLDSELLETNREFSD